MDEGLESIDAVEARKALQVRHIELGLGMIVPVPVRAWVEKREIMIRNEHPPLGPTHVHEKESGHRVVQRRIGASGPHEELVGDPPAVARHLREEVVIKILP